LGKAAGEESSLEEDTMRLRSKTSFLVLPVAAALVLAGCGGGGSGGSASGSSGNGIVSVRGGDPQNPLIPTDTQETEGGMVVDALWSGLEKYNPTTGQAENEVAQSITTSDSKTYDIKLKPWKFHDGTPVTSDSFINAWNYGALKTNAQINAPFFEDIQGYDQVAPSADKAKPTAKTMSGLKKVSDSEFKVTLSAPNSVFKIKLGYTAFYPMPASFFKAPDKAAWAKKPIGNGPFKFDSYTPSQNTMVSRFDGYSGTDKAKVKGVNFKIYTSLDAAYQDLTSGNLDFMEAVPPSALVGGKYKTDLQGRTNSNNLMTSTALAVPDYLNPKWKDPNFRKAVSMAIDRDQIVKTIFNGTRKPMDGWVPSSVPGAAPNACGDSCKFNPTEAKKLMAKSGFKGVIPIQSNSDGGHKEWIEAVANSINTVFKGTGVTAQFSPVPTFQVMRQNETAFKMNGLWRSGWNFDYPSPDNILLALYQTGGSSNVTKYSNPAFDKEMKKGLAEKTQEAGAKDFATAEKMLADQMPGIPLWTETGTSGYSDRVKSVQLSTLKRLPDLTTIELK
jgi:oligopeptide transport system substrate-binding protein